MGKLLVSRRVFSWTKRKSPFCWYIQSPDSHVLFFVGSFSSEKSLVVSPVIVMSVTALRLERWPHHPTSRMNLPQLNLLRSFQGDLRIQANKVQEGISLVGARLLILRFAKDQIMCRWVFKEVIFANRKGRIGRRCIDIISTLKKIILNIQDKTLHPMPVHIFSYKKRHPFNLQLCYQYCWHGDLDLGVPDDG